MKRIMLVFVVLTLCSCSNISSGDGVEKGITICKNNDGVNTFAVPPPWEYPIVHCKNGVSYKIPPKGDK